MPDLLQVNDQFRHRLLARDAQSTAAIVVAYSTVWHVLVDRLNALVSRIEQAQEQGQPIGPAWLISLTQTRQLLLQTAREIDALAPALADHITAEQAAAVTLAQRALPALVSAAMGPPPPDVHGLPVARLPREAVTDLVGFLSDGSPLRDLLDSFGADASRRIRDVLLTGLATGENPKQIARRVQDAFGGNLMRAITVSRTEVLRAYRTAAIRSFAANEDVVEGWTWVAAVGRNPPPCAACFALHGSVHPLDEPFSSHPRCRCTPAPRSRSWADLGFDVPESRPEIEPGAELFERLRPAQQRDIIGTNAGFAAYREGKLELADLIGERHDPRWGPVRYQKSVKEALAS